MTKHAKQNKQNKSAKRTVNKQLVIRAPPSKQLSSGRVSKVWKPSTHSTVGGKIPQFPLACISPFSEAAFGVKVPDNNLAPSVTAFSRDIVSLGTGTIGGQAIVFRHQPGSMGYNLTMVTPTTWTTAASYPSFPAANLTSLANQFAAIRTAAWGIKITTRQAATVASGVVHIALIADSQVGTTWSVPQNVSQMENSPYYRRVPIADLIEDDIYVSGRYTDQTAFAYYDPSHLITTNNTQNDTAGWLQIMIAIEGPVSTVNMIDIDLIHHYEAFTGVASSGILSLTAAAPASPVEMAATATTLATVPPITVSSEVGNDANAITNDIVNIYQGAVQIATGVVSILPKATSLVGSLLSWFL
jgi:hypothetical protein